MTRIGAAVTVARELDAAVDRAGASSRRSRCGRARRYALRSVHTLDVGDATLWSSVELEGARENPNAVDLIDGSRFAWQRADDRLEARIFDTRTGRLRRTVASFPVIQPVSSQPLVLRTRADGGDTAEAFDARGVKRSERVALPGGIVALDAESDASVLAVCEERGTASTFVLVRVDLAAGSCERLLELGPVRAISWALAARGGAAYLTRLDGERSTVEAYALGPVAQRRWSVELAHAFPGDLRDDGVLPLLVPRPGGQRAIAASLAPPEIGETGVSWARWEAGPTVRGIPPYRPPPRPPSGFDAVRLLSSTIAILDGDGDGETMARELDLIKHFSSYRLRNEDFEYPDLLGAAYEYLIRELADSAGKKGGEFYTPRPVVRMMVRIAEPKEGMQIYDPARARAACSSWPTSTSTSTA